MNRLIKPLAVISAIILIYSDLSALFMQESVTGATLFSTLFLRYIPCGILVAVSAMLKLFEKNFVKLWSIITMAVSAFMGIVRLSALVLQLVSIGNGTGLTGTWEYFEIAKFSAEFFVLVGFFFLCLGFVRGGFRKTTLCFGLTAVVTLTVYHIADVVFAVKSMEGSGVSGIGGFLSNCLTYEFVIGVFLTIAYLLLFSIMCGIFEGENTNG
ncbi:MAG: hypothetical protein IJE01_01105 [Clostridia bacterium]|nr:hypothetical protein [Clostridia bacterium]